MAEQIPNSDLHQMCKFIQEVSAIILKQFRKGCLCTIHTNSFVRLVKNSFEIINSEYSGKKQDPETEKVLTKTFLSFVSCLRTLIKTLVQLDTFDSEDSGSDATLCKQFHEWILILVRSSDCCVRPNNNNNKSFISLKCELL